MWGKNKSAQQVDQTQNDRTSPTSLFPDLLRVLAVIPPTLSGNTAVATEESCGCTSLHVHTRISARPCTSARVSVLYLEQVGQQLNVPKVFCCLANIVNVVVRFEAVGKFCPFMESGEQPSGSNLSWRCWCG